MDNINEHFDSSEDGKIHQILGELKDVSAPKDFDFRVKARIAAGGPSAISGFRIPTAIRFAVPLVLLLLVGAYFGLNALYSPANTDVPSVAKYEPATAPLLPPRDEAGVTEPSVKIEPAEIPRSSDAANTVAQRGIAPGVKVNSVVPKKNLNGGSF